MEIKGSINQRVNSSHLRSDYYILLYTRAGVGKTFTINDQTINILGFAGQSLSKLLNAAIYCVKAAIDNMYMSEHGHVPIKFIYKNRYWA